MEMTRIDTSTPTQRLDELYKRYDANIEKFTKVVSSDINTFIGDVDGRYNTLEFPKDATTPEKTALTQEAQDFKRRYRELCFLQEKIEGVYRALKGALGELKQHGSVKMKQEVKAETPTDELNFAQHIKKIKEQTKNIKPLKNQIAQMLPKAESSLGYFLQIVANDGKPISNYSRLSNSIYGVKVNISGSYSGLLGSVFDGFLDRVDQSIQGAINSAEKAGENLIADAGREVYVAIENAKNAYKDSLKYTVDTLSKAVLLNLDAINSMVQDLESKNADLINKLVGQAQQLINSLPFASRQPQLTFVMPRYAAIGANSTAVHYKFSGNFVDASRDGYAPTFFLNDQPAYCVGHETQRLEFMVSVGAIKDPAKDKNSYNIGTLNISWDNGWIFSNKTSDQFKVYLGILPLSPGKFTVEYAKSNQVAQRKHHVSEKDKEWGDNDYGKGTSWVTRKDTFYPDSGWQIDVNTVSDPILEPGAHGSHTQEVSKKTKDFVEVTVGLAVNDGKHMGRIEFHEEFDETQNQTVVSKRTQDLPMGWGDSKVLESNDPSETFSKLSVTLFDGTQVEFAGSNSDNAYVHVSNQNGKFVVSSIIPNDAKIATQSERRDLFSKHVVIKSSL